MFIQKIIIQGFKTYKNKTVIGPLGDKFNLILGKNGSGKSNLFDAIQFVLSDKFSRMTPEERRRLLHEGSGAAVMSASVEIVFDNHNRRLPVDHDFPSIKRTIGLKKDEYFLSNKHCRKEEIKDLLESAGLSRYNPYNIVQQGKVKSLTNMTEEQRLNLLKDIAGTRTYDDRRKESQRLMKDTDSRRQQVQEVIEYMEKRLEDLQKEKDELAEFQALDSQRRCLEHTIYTQQLAEAKSKLEELEQSRGLSTETADKLHDEAAEARDKRVSAEEQLKRLEQEQGELQASLKALQEERRAAVKQLSKVELEMNDAQEKLEQDSTARQAAQDELKQLTEKMTKAETDLAKVVADFDKKTETELNAKEQLEQMYQRQQELYARQGRSEQFKSKKDRDAYLNKEIKALEKNLQEESKRISQLEREGEKRESRTDKMTKSMEKRSQSIESAKQQIEDITKRLEVLHKRRDEATDSRKDSWREVESMDKEVQVIKQDIQRKERELQFTMDKHLSRGIQIVKRVAEEKKIKGVHGPLIELFSCDSRFRTAVETVAGNRLFHVVVESDEVASKLIKALNKEGGRVTFIPLNTVRVTDRQYPTKNSEALPLLERLKFNSIYRKAMQQVFGKTLVVRNLEMGPQLARQYGLNCVTLDGDQVDRKGALTGGFIENKHSRLELQQSLKDLREKFEELSGRHATAKRRSEEQDQEVTLVLGEFQKLGAEKQKLRNDLIAAQEDVSQLQKNLAIEQKAAKAHEITLRNMRTAYGSLESKLRSLQSELKTELREDLNTQDNEELTGLTTELEQLQKELTVATNARTEVEIKKTKLEHLLEDNLKKRYDELMRKVESQAAEADVDVLEAERDDMKELKQSVEELSLRIAEAEKRLDKDTSEVRKLQGKVETLRSEEQERERRVTSESKTMEKIHNKRSILSQKRDDCIKKILELGGTPTGVEKYAKKSVKELLNLLEKCNRKLKKYSHVNKKAIDQFLGFTNQHEELLKRKQQLDEGRESILKLIEHLDQKKDEAIRLTFKMIAKQFSKVFSELVPGGKAKLVIHSSAAADAAAGSATDEKKDETSAATFTGVGMDVSFAGGQQMMRHLSGGQATVVALSLIFAIQRCDPSPFYIFDEIDSALDPIYRTSVAKMVAAQAKDTQFLAVTQNKEMVATAHEIYRVEFRNKVSMVGPIDREDAVLLMSEIEEEEQERAKQQR